MHYKIIDIIYWPGYSIPTFKISGELFDYFNYQIININGSVKICNLFEVHFNDQKKIYQDNESIKFDLYFELNSKLIKKIEEYRYKTNEKIYFDFNINVLYIKSDETKNITQTNTPPNKNIAIELSKWKKDFISKIMNVNIYEFEIILPNTKEVDSMNDLIAKLKIFQNNLFSESLKESSVSIRKILEDIKNCFFHLKNDITNASINSKDFNDNLQSLIKESYELSSKFIHQQNKSNKPKIDNIDIEDIHFFFIHTLNLMSYISKKFYKSEFIKKNI